MPLVEGAGGLQAAEAVQPDGAEGGLLNEGHRGPHEGRTDAASARDLVEDEPAQARAVHASTVDRERAGQAAFAVERGEEA